MRVAVHHDAIADIIARLALTVRAFEDGSPQDGRSYDGLEKNPDGTYTGMEIKPGSAIDRYVPSNTQKRFDDAVNAGTPARGRLDGEDIVITHVEVSEVP